ncbi:MAG: hypothetical protein KA158_04010 [Leucobacter sp.]|nr:hypothetical protein [Leucobacter sp.]
MPQRNDYRIPHPATDTEAPNGEGTASPPTRGATLNRPVLDGASEYYGELTEADGVEADGLEADDAAGDTVVPE